jgi:hypothetical protein
MADYDQAAEQQIQAAPLPTPQTLRHRRNFFYQVFRFIAVNLKMVRAAAFH